MIARLPSVGGFSGGKPDGWVPGDDDDPRIDGQTRLETDEALASEDHYGDLLEQAAGDFCFKANMKRLVSLCDQLNNKPHQCFDKEKLELEIVECADALSDSFADVASAHIRKTIESGESYIYLGPED